MYKLYGVVLFIVGGGFLLIGAYSLYVGYVGGLVDWRHILYSAGGCLFGYLLTIAGYRMSMGDRL
jgi:hypothetical protein